MSTAAATETFTTSRLGEYFSVRELTLQIGRPPEQWRIALTKELVDNALDAAERNQENGGETPPTVSVTNTTDILVIEDNGDGIAPETVKAILDYSTRTSSNSKYIQPSRGQLGNALKCVFAAPAVLAPGAGLGVTLESQRRTHRVTITNNPFTEAPEINHAITESAVRNGTRIRVEWGSEACVRHDSYASFYRGRSPNCRDVEDVLQRYCVFTPDAVIRYNGSTLWQEQPGRIKRWRCGDRTDIFWYEQSQFSSLVAAVLNKERNGAEPRPLRDFVGTFAALTGTAKAKAVLADAGLSGAMLSALATRDGMNAESLRRLSDSMRKHAVTPRNPESLGCIGKDNAALALRLADGASDVRYHRKMGLTTKQRPFVVEVAFGVTEGSEPPIRFGVNWTPFLSHSCLEAVLRRAMIDHYDPASILVHLVTPHVTFTDRGKVCIELDQEVRTAIDVAAQHVTAKWRKKKEGTARDQELSRKQLEAFRSPPPEKRTSLRDASWQVMAQAHAHVIGGRIGAPANARQIMYAARKLIQAILGTKSWKDSDTFTQKYLPQYLKAHPVETANWNVVYDERGELLEPHGGRVIGLGTTSVREYLYRLGSAPPDRYRFVLMIEKEGFKDHLAHAQIANRFDVALAWTKGMSTTSCRELVDGLSALGVETLILHDFDVSGLGIAYTLSHDSDRYKFKNTPLVRDIGIRMADVTALALEGEGFEFGKNKKGEPNKDPRILLAERGVPRDERDFLVSGLCDGQYVGRRVELNELPTQQFIAFIEGKLTEAGATKIVPDEERLRKDFADGWRSGMVSKLIDAAEQKVREEVDAMEVPYPDGGLAGAVRDRITGTARYWAGGLEDLVEACLPDE